MTEALRAMTPDHRLERRSRGPGDDEAYRRKLRVLPDRLLAIKLADRVHNYRDLAGSASPERNRRFLAQLADFYLPLAHARGQASPTIRRLAVLLQDHAPEGEWAR
jgi:GTP pyrophosphokinase